MAEPHIPTVDEVRDEWDNFSENYERDYQEWTNLTDVECQFLAKLDNAKAVVVPGVGPGLGGLQVRQKVKPDAKVYVGDLSPEMVKLSKLLFKKNGYDVDATESNTKVEVMDNQNLPLETESCDRYVANLSIMYVPDPIKQFQEALRVLQPGGIAVFSTWGRPELSSFFTLLEKVTCDMGLPSPNTRSGFHLGNAEETKKMALDAGFRKVFVHYKTLRQHIYNPKEYSQLIKRTDSWESFFNDLGERLDEYFERLEKGVQCYLEEDQLLSFDHLIITAIK
eukprot:CAMPEP_0115024934 /NCGR_PEP_ID=MMETSP0216-20121206/33626_1 /TAXON_ID=223996 /ORGANISM="Protocruzia adherens, Strain Boccale" /LENGTH=279 /DNA_ID=CAMNT_0002399273 /DNA_START=36 /DNA_END=875 /DNA_ORIENTATION=-